MEQTTIIENENVEKIQSAMESPLDMPHVPSLPNYLDNLMQKRDNAVRKYKQSRTLENKVAASILRQAVRLEFSDFKQKSLRFIFTVEDSNCGDALYDFIREMVDSLYLNRLLHKTTGENKFRWRFNGTRRALEQMIEAHKEKFDDLEISSDTVYMCEEVLF